MPLSFLNPGLLFGAAAAAVPLLLHLLQRRRVRATTHEDVFGTVESASMMRSA